MCIFLFEKNLLVFFIIKYIYKINFSKLDFKRLVDYENIIYLSTDFIRKNKYYQRSIKYLKIFIINYVFNSYFFKK